MLREGAYQVGPPPLADGASAFKISFYLPHTHTSNAGSSAPTLPRPHPPSGADTLRPMQGCQHPPSPGHTHPPERTPFTLPPQEEVMLREGACQVGPPPLADGGACISPPLADGDACISGGRMHKLLKFLSIFHTPTHPMQGRQHPPSPGHAHPPERTPFTLPPQEEVRFREGACQVGPPPLADGGACISGGRMHKCLSF